MQDTTTNTLNQLVPDPFYEGLQRGWKAVDASTLKEDVELTCDVVIIGTGAGGGITAEMLTKAGLDVLLIEEGPLKTSRDFKMRESDAFSKLYQESGGRTTTDKSISIFQGRAVGGSTAVNWTSSFRTPANTLEHWRQVYGVDGQTVEGMLPWFEQAERRLNVGEWNVPPNQNNDALKRGCEKLGLSFGYINRNVRNCWNLGYCGMGCPVNAKQSMLVTCIPTAMEAGARLYSRLRAQRFVFEGKRVNSLVCEALGPEGLFASGVKVRVVAKHYVAAGGAINNPGLLLRSSTPDPHRILGSQTTLHPVVAVASLMPERVDGFNGAPQTVYSDHFMNTEGFDGRIGFKIETPPIHPVLVSTVLPGDGESHQQMMKRLPDIHLQIALMRDGFHEQSKGGQIVLQKDGSPIIDYPLNDYIWDGARRAMMAMGEIQFAAGAKEVFPVHERYRATKTFAEFKALMSELKMEKGMTKVFCAHVMGGCRMSGSEKNGVVRPDGVHWQIENLSIHDGSIFPTSIGANPQLSIFGQATRLSAGLIKQLTGKEALPLA